MPTVDAELKRRDAMLNLVNWLLVDDTDNTETALSDPVIEYGLRALFTSLAVPATVRDDFNDLEILADQSGAGGVLTFSFTSDVQLIWVRSVGDISRAGLAGDLPTATKGIYCADDEPTPITLQTDELRVFAPAGAEVSVWGFRRA